MDVLLLALHDTGVGCYMGQHFPSALGYADDIVLVTLTAHVMRQLPAVYGFFGKKYSVLFNSNV